MTTDSTLLLTSFEPFGGESVNPSAEVARALQGRLIAGVQVAAVQLPCVFGRARNVLQAALHRYRPVLVLALGQASGRSELTLERVAINVDDARMPDNAGAQPIDEPIEPAGPAAYFSTLPIKAIVAALRAAGHPASVSQTAGTFVCNHVFYGLQHVLAGSDVRSGFMHLPALPAQAAAAAAGMPSLDLQTQIAGVALALEVGLTVHEDRRESGGSIA